MVLYEQNHSLAKVSFKYSPFFEMLCSLHVLMNPEHHLERLNWARELKDKMDSSLYDRLLYLGRISDEWLGIMDFCEVSESFNDFNVIAAIESLLEVSVENLLYVSFNEEVEVSSIKNRTGLSKEQLEIVIDGESFRRELISCLKSYYYLHFEKELRFIEPLLIRSMRKQINIMESIGIDAFVATIHNRIEVTPSSFVLHKYVDFIIPFEGLKIIDIRISSFIDPHLLIGMSEGRAQFTLRAHLLESANELPLDLYNTMKALGDDTRLKMLKSIYKGKASTQSLAKQLNLTEACISKHLKLMYEADILYKKREGNYIYYLLNKLVLDRIPMDIYQYLDG